MDDIKLYDPNNKTQASKAISHYHNEIKRLQKLFGIDGKKQCSVCHDEKPIEEFHAKQSKCRACCKIYFNKLYNERQKKKQSENKPNKKE